MDACDTAISVYESCVEMKGKVSPLRTDVVSGIMQPSACTSYLCSFGSWERGLSC